MKCCIDEVYALIDRSDGVCEGLLLIVVEVHSHFDVFTQVVHVLMDEIPHMVRIQRTKGVYDGNIVHTRAGQLEQEVIDSIG